MTGSPNDQEEKRAMRSVFYRPLIRGGTGCIYVVVLRGVSDALPTTDAYPEYHWRVAGRVGRIFTARRFSSW